MKKIKFITAMILITLSMVFIGEIYVWHSDSFTMDYPVLTFYQQKNVPQEKMIEDISMAAKERKLDFFVVEKRIQNLFSSQLHIYGTKGAFLKINQNSEIREGKFKSLFLGEIEVASAQFKMIPDISKTNSYYMIGTKENIIKFWRDLKKAYAGGFPLFPKAGIKSTEITLFIWSVVFLILLLLTLYEVILTRKETMIRVMSGENIHHCILKNIAVDLAFYIFVFAVLYFGLNPFTNVQFLSGITVTCFMVFLLLNTLIHLKLYQIDYKKDITSNLSASNALGASYVLKTITIIMVILTMSGNIEVIREGIDYYRQREFFETYRNYSYLRISTADSDKVPDSWEKNRMLYKRTQESGQAMSLVDLSQWNGNSLVFANSGAIPYLQKKIPELKANVIENKVYFIVPAAATKKKELLNEVKEVWNSYYPGNYDYEIITYKKRTAILAIENIGKVKSTILENPIVILTTLPSDSVNEYWNIGYLANSTMYRYTPEEWQNFVSEIKYEDEIHYQTNVLEHYLFQWQFIKRNLYAGMVLLIMLLVVEGIVIRTVLRFEYTVNATELSLKKVFGYSVYERYKKLLLLTACLGTAAVAVSVIVGKFLELTTVANMVAGGVMVLLLELVFMAVNIHRLESRSIQRILKGERL